MRFVIPAIPPLQLALDSTAAGSITLYIGQSESDGYNNNNNKNDNNHSINHITDNDINNNDNHFRFNFQKGLKKH